MPIATPSDNDLKILDILSQTESVSQRRLVADSGLSLGMVNLILKRLARTGYIKMISLNKRKVSYLVTRKGLAEKASRSYAYVRRTVQIYQQYEHRINDLVQSHLNQGKRQFVVAGEGELADLVELVLRSKGDGVGFRREEPSVPETRDDEVVLNCALSNGRPVKGISILEAIIKPQSAAHR